MPKTILAALSTSEQLTTCRRPPGMRRTVLSCWKAWFGQMAECVLHAAISGREPLQAATWVSTARDRVVTNTQAAIAGSSSR